MRLHYQHSQCLVPLPFFQGQFLELIHIFLHCHQCLLTSLFEVKDRQGNKHTPNATASCPANPLPQEGGQAGIGSSVLTPCCVRLLSGGAPDSSQAKESYHSALGPH